MTEGTRALTAVPPFCESCRREIILGCEYGPLDPWIALEVVAGLALFQASAADPGVHERAGGESSALTIVLAEIGCLGCFKPKSRDAFVKAIRERGFSSVAQQVKAEPWPDADGPSL